MRVPFVDLGIQYRTLAGEIDVAIHSVLQRSNFILGEDVAMLEADFAQYLGSKYAVGVGSGLAALELALRAFGIGPGDEVITAANTFIATVLAIAAVGAKPVLVDVDPGSYNMDPRALSAAITPRTQAVIPVHLYGQPADLDAILAVAGRHGLLVIEDAAQAHGAHYKKRRVGSFGHAAAFSFYPTKNLGAYGDGGMVVTDDPQIAEKVRLLSNYGQQTKYYHSLMGTNSRLDSLQAAILRVKLKHLDRWNTQRREHASAYNRFLADLPVGLPSVSKEVEPVYHLYVIQVENRKQLQESLRAQGIDTGIHYPIPVHLQEACSHLEYRPGDFPITEAAAMRVLSLPMYPELTRAQVEYVSDTLSRTVSNA